jgi:hypothetical protein
MLQDPLHQFFSTELLTSAMAEAAARRQSDPPDIHPWGSHVLPAPTLELAVLPPPVLAAAPCLASSEPTGS